MGRDRVTAGDGPAALATLNEVESEDDSKSLLIEWNVAKMPCTFWYTSVCPAHLFILPDVSGYG